MLNNLFGCGDDNMLLLLLLLFIGFGDQNDCGGGFGGDNILWILILFLLVGNQDCHSC